MRQRWLRTLRLLACSAFVVSLAGGAAAQAAVGGAGRAEATKVTVVFPAASITLLPFYAAIGEGYFAQNGLDVSPFRASGNSEQILLSGSAQISLDAAAPVISAIAKGGDAVIIGANVNRVSLVALAKTSIPSVAALRGKSIATSAPNSIGDIATKQMLERFGVSPSDVDIKYIVSVPARIAAAKSGSVDAIVVSPPFGVLLRDGQMHKIFDLRGLRLTLQTVTTTRSYLQANPEVVKGFLRAMTLGDRWVANPKNRSQALEYLKQATSLSDAADLNEAYAYDRKLLQLEPVITRPGLDNSLSWANSALGSDLKVADVFDGTLLTQVLTYRVSSRLRGGVFSGTLAPDGTLRWRLDLGKAGPTQIFQIKAAGAKAAVTLCRACGSSTTGKSHVYHYLSNAIKTGKAYVYVTSKKGRTSRSLIATRVG